MGNQPPTDTPAKGRSGVPWLRALSVAVLMVSSLLVASPAWATLVPQPKTTFSSTAGVGLSLVKFQITVTNVSNGVGDATHQMDPVQLMELGFIPSCAEFNGDSCVSPEPDVFLLKTGPEAATGISGACQDAEFSVAPADGSGRHAIVPNSALNLGPATGLGPLPRHCTVELTMLEVDHVPLTDVDPAAAGVQTTRQVDAEISTLEGTDSGTQSHKANVTVIRAKVALWGVSSPNLSSGATLTAGSSSFDAVTVKRQNTNANPDPAGTVSFELIGPGPNLACSAPVAFASDPVPVDPATGVARSPESPPLGEGLYNWVATYSGDANYQGIASPVGCSSDSQRFAVDPAAPPKATAAGSDYDGNGTTDVAVYRPSSGHWFVKDQFVSHWGIEGDIAVPGDYDGNGTTDVAVYRPSNGAWYIKGQFNAHWGIEGDIAVPGDYDGNGTTDVAVYRPSNGHWFVKDQFVSHWGIEGDIAVPGDYDGNGTTDVAVYRPSNGHWFVKDQFVSHWGIEGDIAVPGDYDGNGTTDVAVYRPSNGAWYIKGQFSSHWGIEGDVPSSAPVHLIEKLLRQG